MGRRENGKRKRGKEEGVKRAQRETGFHAQAFRPWGYVYGIWGLGQKVKKKVCGSVWVSTFLLFILTWEPTEGYCPGQAMSYFAFFCLCHYHGTYACFFFISFYYFFISSNPPIGWPIAKLTFFCPTLALLPSLCLSLCLFLYRSVSRSILFLSCVHPPLFIQASFIFLFHSHRPSPTFLFFIPFIPSFLIHIYTLLSTLISSASKSYSFLHSSSDLAHLHLHDHHPLPLTITLSHLSSSRH